MKLLGGYFNALRSIIWSIRVNEIAAEIKEHIDKIWSVQD